MAKDKKATINVQDTGISILPQREEDFNSLEFEGIKNEAGRNSFYLPAKKWSELTNALGLIAAAGRYGGTYAHNDIAFEFGSWLSPEFKLYLIKEFQRLKDDENRRLSLKWNLNRTLANITAIESRPSYRQALSLRDNTTSSAILPMISRGFWLLLELESRYKRLPVSSSQGCEKPSPSVASGFRHPLARDSESLPERRIALSVMAVTGQSGKPERRTDCDGLAARRTPAKTQRQRDPAIAEFVGQFVTAPGACG